MRAAPTKASKARAKVAATSTAKSKASTNSMGKYSTSGSSFTTGIVYRDYSGKWMYPALSSTLTELEQLEGNHFKFYRMQISKHPDNTYTLDTHWGRIGSVGRKGVEHFDNVIDAKLEFRKKFREKTQNDWEERKAGFVPHTGKYSLTTP